MTQLNRLFCSGNIGRMELKNRLVMAPMGTMSHDKEGYILARTVDYYAERARGGVALVICQSSSILFESRAPRRPGVWDDKFIPGLSKISEAIHQNGAKAALQILHHGKLLTAHRKGMEHPEEIGRCKDHGCHSEDRQNRIGLKDTEETQDLTHKTVQSGQSHR